MPSEILHSSELEEIRAESSRLVQAAHAIVIDCQDAYVACAGFLLNIKAHMDYTRGKFMKPKKLAHEAHLAVTSLENECLAPDLEAERIIKPKMAAWNFEQERKRRQEQEKAEAEARKQAEDEKIAQAAALEKAGDTAAAEEVMAEPIMIPPIVRPVETPKVPGISYSTVWRARVTDMKALIDAVAAGKAPIAILTVDEIALNKIAAALKNTLHWPGVEAYSEQIVRGSGRKAA